MLKRVVMNLDVGLIKDIDAYAAQMHLNRTAAVSVLCSTSLNQDKMLKLLPEIMQAYKASEEARKDDEEDSAYVSAHHDPEDTLPEPPAY